MTEKQLRFRIKQTEEALKKERDRNTEKMARVGWGSGFRKHYIGPCCRHQSELEYRLADYKRQLKELEEEHD